MIASEVPTTACRKCRGLKSYNLRNQRCAVCGHTEDKPRTTVPATYLATVVGGLLVRRTNDITHARHALMYARMIRLTGSDGAHVARAQRLAHDAVRWVREDIVAITDVSLCPCGSVYRCTCVAPF